MAGGMEPVSKQTEFVVTRRRASGSGVGRRVRWRVGW